MGLIDKFLDKYTEEVEVKDKKKKSFWDSLFEESSKPSFWDSLFEEEKQEVAFADSELIDEISKNLSEKIRDKRKDLKIIGISITSVKLETIPDSEEVVKEYMALLDELKDISDAEERIKSDNIVERMQLQSKYDEFEKRYEREIPRIKSLYLLSEMMKRNIAMKKDYDKKPVSDITEKKIEDYKEYIKRISEQSSDIHPQYQKQLMNELIEAEYRLRMLILMRNVYKGKEVFNNPFARETDTKKSRYEEMFLEDISELNNQYNRVTSLQKRYIKSGLFSERDFTELDNLSDEIIDRLNNGIIDDFSITEIFSNKELDTLKGFVRLKAKLNEIESQYDQIQWTSEPVKTVEAIKPKSQKGKKAKKTPDYYYDDSYGYGGRG